MKARQRSKGKGHSSPACERAAMSDADRLMKAVLSRDRKEVESCLRHGMSGDVCDKHGNTALNGAIQIGDEEIALLLLRAGANPRKLDGYGATPLILASNNGLERVVSFLIKAGVNLDTEAKAGVVPYHSTALSLAARNGHDRIVRKLILAGADVNKNPENWSAISAAAEAGHIGIVRALVAAGGKASGRSLLTPVELRRLELVKCLVEAGADVNFVTKGGDSVLGFAIRGGDARVLKFLIDSGAYVNQPSGRRTPLILAVCKQDAALVEVVLNAGANVHARDEWGATALMEAAIRENRKILERLLTAGANPLLKTREGKLPVELAKQHKQFQNVEILNRRRRQPSRS